MSYKKPFWGKNLKKRGLITDHFWDDNFKRYTATWELRKKSEAL